jgi:penicillin G amidase
MARNVGAAERMREERIEVAGLAQPATITVDRWGIPHIRAETSPDMYFVQGFNAARDRLWQLDIWRKRGLGLLSADFGAGYVEQDRAARLFLYRGDMAREWACYGADAEVICRRFVAGINAYIDLCKVEPQRLPPEFVEMGIRPSHWAAEDVVRIRSHSMMRNAISEVVRSHVLANCDPVVDALRQKLEPAHDLLAAEDERPEALPLDCLDVFKLAVAPVTFGRERLAATLDTVDHWRKVTPLGEVIRDQGAQGSNNWTVAAHRTNTGRPILAGDPHRQYSVPSLRYIVHIASPEFNGIGAGEPALPGISMGHNGTSAFGLTLFYGHDQEDVYRYETHPEDPDLYRYEDGWERIETVRETLQIKGGEEAGIALRFTRHGPVVAEYPERRLLVAIRTVWTDPGTAPYFRSIASMRAKSFGQFREVMAGWGVPAVNQVYADTQGDIGWVVAGFSPVRPNWDGLLPVPGDGKYEWAGYMDGAELPYALNPSAGYIATANEFNLPADWPADKQIGYEWLDGSRAKRIAEILATERVHSIKSAKALQTDVCSIPGRRLIALLGQCSGRDAREADALKMLAAWEGFLRADSAAGALCEIWWSQHLRPMLFARLKVPFHIVGLLDSGHVESMLDHLEGLAKEADSSLETLLLDSLGAAYAACQRRFGEDPSLWSWGKVHQAYFEHPVAGVRPELADQFDVGPYPVGGSDSTPMNGKYRPKDFRLATGASFRMVLDVGAWDNSVCINTPGQSGDPRSPHYSDLAPLWADGEYVPLLYSEEAIEAAAVLKIWLKPTVG